MHTEVRLARLDAVDTASAKGQFDGIASDRVLILNGTALETLAANGALRTLGRLAAAPMWTGPGTVAVKPDLSQWLYTVTDTSLTSFVHLGTPSSDRVVATVSSPDGYTFYPAYGWNVTGAYLSKQPTGLGGVGPFLEYHFPLVKFDVASGRMTDVSPVCYAYALLDDGGTLCRASSTDTHLQVRTQSGLTLTMQATLGAAYHDFARVHVTPDNSRLVLSRSTSSTTVNYQMAVAGLTESTATPFGAVDFVPDTWLPDGRLVADHLCWPADMGGGSCNASLDGTYVFSADGRVRTLFYKLSNAGVVGYV